MAINVLLLAGGIGSRVGTEVPKQFLELNGEPIIIRTLKQFERNESIDMVFVVCLEKYIVMLKKMLSEFHIHKVKLVLKGGNTSHESLKNGLFAMRSFTNQDDYVVIHESVRPFVSQNDINNLIVDGKKYGCSCSASKCYETIMTKNEKEFAINEIDRECIVRIMMPQMYKFCDILNVVSKSLVDGKTFVSANTMMTHYGFKIHLSPCSNLNIKITTMDDFIISSGISKLLDEQQ